MVEFLKNIANVTAGNSAPAKDQFSKEGIPFVRAGSLEFLVRGISIDECEKVDVLIAKEKKLRLFSKGSILFAKSGMSAKMGRVFVLPQDAYVVSHLAVITVTSELVNHSYIAYYFNHRPPFNLIKDDAYPSISISDIENVEIPLPDLETQNKIVAILDKATALLDKREKTIAMYDELLRAAFLEMFGDVPCFEKNQKSLPLGHYISIKHGFAFQSEFFSDTGEFVLLTPGNFKESGGFRERGIKQKYFIGSIPKAYVLQKDALLIAMTEQAPGLLGSPLIVPESNKYLHNQRLGLIIPKDEALDKTFLFYLFNTGKMRYIIHSRSTGVKVRHTSPSKIEEIEVEMPSYKKQQIFCQIAKKTEKLIEHLIKSRSHINDLVNALSQAAFKNELDFNTAVDLEVLLDNDYESFTMKSNRKTIQLLLERLDNNEVNNRKFNEPVAYDKAKGFVFELLKEGKVKQVYDEQSKTVKLTLA